MAIRSEDLYERHAEVLVFPVRIARQKAARQQRATFIRRRVALASVVAAIVVSFLGVAAAGGAPRSVPEAPRTVRVEAGATVWDLAERFASPDTDPRAYVDAVWELNDLDGPPRPGTVLELPR